MNARRAPFACAVSRMRGKSLSLSPGMSGAHDTPTSMPASLRARMASKRVRGEGAKGSTARATAASRKGTVMLTVAPPSRARRARMSMSRRTSAPLVMMATPTPRARHTSRQRRVRR